MKEVVILCLLVISKVELSMLDALNIDERQIEIDEIENFNNEEVWGPLLEDYVTSNNNRESRVLRIIPTSEALISDDIKAENTPSSEKESKISSGNKIVNNGAYMYPNTVNNVNNVKPKPQSHQVTETDLYLLGAIEKLVYRVDFMEKRLRRVEEMLYYNMAGNRIDQEPCPNNFTRVANGCYLFASNAGREGDWKMANKHCHRMGTFLVEFETPEEFQDVVSFIQITSHLRGKDFWTGGLNPGLLWIWSNSGRPVATKSNITGRSINTEQGRARQNKPKKPAASNISAAGKQPGVSGSITMAGGAISGEGPCLRLAYDPMLRTYVYRGTDCSIRYNYLCELGDVTASNQIKRLGRSRKILGEL